MTSIAIFLFVLGLSHETGYDFLPTMIRSALDIDRRQAMEDQIEVVRGDHGRFIDAHKKLFFRAVDTENEKKKIS